MKNQTDISTHLFGCIDQQVLIWIKLTYLKDTKEKQMNTEKKNYKQNIQKVNWIYNGFLFFFLAGVSYSFAEIHSSYSYSEA